MTVTATLSAAPEPYLGPRHRVVDSRSGLTRLITMKVLKHANVDTPDTVASLMRITARGAAHIHNQTSLCLHVVPMTAAALSTVGMLITLYIAILLERQGPHPLHSAAGPCYETCSAAGHSVVVDVRGASSGVGKVGTDHAIHRIA